MTGLRLLALLALLLSSGAISKEMTSLDPPQLTLLCAPDEPGEKLEFWGRVLDYQGRPLASTVIVDLARGRDGAWTFQQDIRLEGD